MDSTIESEQQAYQQANSEERGTWRRKSKINHFWSWFMNVGSKKFLHVYGRSYDEDCEADRKLVVELWNLDKESWSTVERHGGRSALPRKGGWKQISPDYEFECLVQRNRATNFRTNDLSPPRGACTTYYLVDENANDRALHFLASTVGTDQLQIHAEIMDKMVVAQDFISALAWLYYRVIEKPLPNYLTDEIIDRQFTDVRQPAGISDRQRSSLLNPDCYSEAVCNLCYVGDLVKFRDHYDDSTHSMRRIFVDSATLQFSRTTSRFTEDCPHDGGAYARHGAIVEVNLSDAMSRLMKIGSFCCPV
ncbi:unnamed protein product [Angiostrongylus costaricensis]|uniref:BTB domain-containing protein n=1 Tax=Angiostrongylus costaricensis TaxID=334426 RepID=A0A158PMF5_ANGCS|nr:unnamed protein product [Angiostrongylus costaricensis]